MALPPDSSETFKREVDENLRRDQIRDWAKHYGGWLIGGMILFLVAVGGWLFWQQYKVKRSADDVEQMAQIYQDIGTGANPGAEAKLDAIAEHGTPAVRGSAGFGSAAVALQGNDRSGAIAKYRAMAADGALPQPYRDLALIRQTALEFDAIKPEEVVARMQPLTKPGNPWFGSAGEMTAMAYIKQGKKTEAGRLFAAIAADKGVPASVRGRAVQIAGSLGIDASASLPTTEQ